MKFVLLFFSPQDPFRLVDASCSVARLLRIAYYLFCDNWIFHGGFPPIAAQATFVGTASPSSDPRLKAHRGTRYPISFP